MSEGKIKVAVSPFYQGFGWRDVALNKDFKPQPRLIPIVISNDEDLSEVVRRVRLNHLVLLQGVLPEVGHNIATILFISMNILTLVVIMSLKYKSKK